MKLLGKRPINRCTHFTDSCTLSCGTVLLPQLLPIEQQLSAPAAAAAAATTTSEDGVATATAAAGNFSYAPCVDTQVALGLAVSVCECISSEGFAWQRPSRARHNLLVKLKLTGRAEGAVEMRRRHALNCVLIDDSFESLTNCVVSVFMN